MPWPESVQLGSGQLPLSGSFTVRVRADDPRLHAVAEIFLNDLRRHTGMLPLDFQIADGARTGQLVIQSEHASEEVQKLGEDESYTLVVIPSGAHLDAPTTLGVMRGLQTFLQLVEMTPQGFAVPAVSIQDQPRFPWRGLLIDSSRHFTDYQGFRVESKHFPKLQEMGSDGLYYTQDQLRDVIAYARDRGIRVVPEFDMP